MPKTLITNIMLEKHTDKFVRSKLNKVVHSVVRIKLRAAIYDVVENSLFPNINMPLRHVVRVPRRYDKNVCAIVKTII